MSRWYRVFTLSETIPTPAGIEACLAGVGVEVTARFRADDQGWYLAELYVPGGSPLVLERWQAEEDGIRAELNGWAGYVETCPESPIQRSLMEQIIQSRHLFTLLWPVEADQSPGTEQLCEVLCRHLVQTAGGFYQVDGRGFFAGDGTVLVRDRT